MSKANYKADVAVAVDVPTPTATCYVETAKADRPKPPRGLKHTETVVTHRFPCLLPFGQTTIKVFNGASNWQAKCGGYHLQGWGGTIEEIVKKFVEHVSQEVTAIKWEVESDSFKCV